MNEPRKYRNTQTGLVGLLTPEQAAVFPGLYVAVETEAPILPPSDEATNPADSADEVNIPADIAAPTLPKAGK